MVFLRQNKTQKQRLYAQKKYQTIGKKATKTSPPSLGKNETEGQEKIDKRGHE